MRRPTWLLLGALLLVACSTAAASAGNRLYLPYTEAHPLPTSTPTFTPVPTATATLTATPIAVGLGLVAASSSTSGHGPELATDGLTATYWQPDPTDGSPVLAILLATPSEIGSASILAAGGAGRLSLAVFGSDYGSERTCFSAATAGDQSILLGSCGPFASVQGIRLRLVASDPSNPPGIRSISLYAATTAPTPFASDTPGPTTTASPTGTVTPTGTMTPTGTVTATRTATATATATATPTLTPTPTPTPVGLYVSGVSARTSGTSNVVEGLVTNGSATTLYSPRVTTTYYSGTGQVVASASTYANRTMLQAGESASTSTVVQPVPTYTTLIMSVAGSASSGGATYVHSGIVVSGVSTQQSGSTVYVTGTVENNTGGSLSALYLDVALVDASGKVLDSAQSYPFGFGSTIASGSSTSFSQTFANGDGHVVVASATPIVRPEGY